MYPRQASQWSGDAGAGSGCGGGEGGRCGEGTNQGRTQGRRRGGRSQPTGGTGGHRGRFHRLPPQELYRDEQIVGADPAHAQCLRRRIVGGPEQPPGPKGDAQAEGTGAQRTPSARGDQPRPSVPARRSVRDGGNIRRHHPPGDPGAAHGLPRPAGPGVRYGLHHPGLPRRVPSGHVGNIPGRVQPAEGEGEHSDHRREYDGSAGQLL
mmetsp:Transcript_25281/g.73160  ORF Transcript_25281/g.73160 Transcript_25281/m.73160 type:complete len:208 (+) Transcript_25281:2722-3345(+)